MSDLAGSVVRHDEGSVASIVFDRPSAYNAMTWAMYEQLETQCRALAEDHTVRVVTFRGQGGKAFIAGTDIGQFAAFTGADDGIRYEQQIDNIVGLVETLPQPTVAIVEGWCMGGGLAIAAACDFRLADSSARFGVPIARTVGNCLSMANLARVVAALGVPLTKRLLMAAESLAAESALQAGFVTAVADGVDLDAQALSLCDRLLEHAPRTMHSTKESLRRLSSMNLPEIDDLIRDCYGSEDFKLGVRAFVNKSKPQWTGR